MRNVQLQSSAWETGHHFAPARGLRLASLSGCRKTAAATAYLLVFDSYTAATPGSQAGTAAANAWTPSSPQATWTTGTKCRVNSETTTCYLRTEDAGATYSLYDTLAGALAGDSAHLLALTSGAITVHVLDWIELPWLKLPADPVDNAADFWLDKPLVGRRFEEGLYVLPSSSPTTYAALAADFFFAAEFTDQTDL